MKKIVLIFLALSLLLLPAHVFGWGKDPDSGFRVNPVIQAVTTNSVGIIWETYNSDTGTVEIALNPDMDGSVKTKVNDASANHKVVIEGLTEATQYYYRIKSDGDTSTGSFKTSLTNGSRFPFRLVVYGDSRRSHWAEDIYSKYGDNDDHLAVCQSISSYSPDFLIHVGDYVFSGSNKGDIYNFFSVEKELLGNISLLAAYGNHEFAGGSGADNTLFDNYLIPPKGDSFAWYSYNYGNLHVLILNTGAACFATDNYDHIAPGSPQYKFAEDDLKAASTDSNIDHIIVAFHNPLYSVTSFGDNEKLQQYLEPLFTQYGVKAVFTGHEHDYQHTEKYGVHYILSGGAGSSIFTMPWKGQQDDTKANLIKFAPVLNYVVIDVNGNSLNIEARKVQGNGNSTSSVIESFTL
ncbi:MAG: metallophosphoesterase [Desulfobacterales bacterium]|nr:metallophosphoesterase [Desulfobacterales bacterium]